MSDFRFCRFYNFVHGFHDTISRMKNERRHGNPRHGVFSKTAVSALNLDGPMAQRWHSVDVG